MQTALFAMAIGIYSFTDGRGIITKFLGMKVNRYLGKLSYNFFIFHYVVIHCGGQDMSLRLFDKYGSPGLLAGCLLIFSITLMISVVFQAIQNRIYRYIER